MDPLTVFLLLVGGIAALGLMYLAIEVRTLRDNKPGNHITATVRLMTKEHTGLVVLLWGLLNHVVGIILGHVWAEW